MSCHFMSCSGGGAVRPRGPVAQTFARLKDEGVVMHDMPAPPMPPWAHPFHKATFAKLYVWNASLALGRRLIFLDTDLLLLRNIDHLSAVSRTPAFVMRADRELLNLGLFVVEVHSRAELNAFWRGLSKGVRALSHSNPHCAVSPPTDHS